MFVNTDSHLRGDNHGCRSYDYAVTVGDRIELARERIGVSFAELGRRAGIPGQTITNAVRTARTRPDYVPDAKTVRAIAIAAGVSEVWLLTGKGSPDETSDGPRVEREPQPAYAESEAPILANLPGWADLVTAAQGLDEARSVPAWAFELLGYSNGLILVPLVPSSLVDMAKAIVRYVAPTEAEAKLRELRAKKG